MMRGQTTKEASTHRHQIDGDDSKKKIAVDMIMNSLASNVKAEFESIKKIKQAPAEVSEFKNLMRILNKITERQSY